MLDRKVIIIYIFISIQISYPLKVIQLFVLAEMLSGNRLQQQCNRLPNTIIDYNTSLPLYIQILKSENCNSSFFLKTLIPNSSFCHISLISCPNHSHKAQTSSFFILFHLNQFKCQITPSNGGTIKEAKGFFESKPTTFRDSRNSDSFLHFLFLIVLIRRTTDTVPKSFLFSFHY